MHACMVYKRADTLGAPSVTPAMEERARLEYSVGTARVLRGYPLMTEDDDAPRALRQHHGHVR